MQLLAAHASAGDNDVLVLAKRGLHLLPRVAVQLGVRRLPGYVDVVDATERGGAAKGVHVSDELGVRILAV